MPAWFTAVFPVVTLLLGAGAAFAREAFMQSRQDRREALARQHERQAAAVDRREEFELQHLVEVSELLSAAYEQHWDYRHVEDEYKTALPRTGGDGLYEKVEEKGRALDQVNARLISAAGFILAAEVREAVTVAHDAFEAAYSELVFEEGRPEPNLPEVARKAHEAITARVRAIYAGRGQAGPPELP